MTDQQFFRGTLVIFITSVILKILGFFYQIVTIRLIGSEPVGILNMAYPFYITFVVLATAGIPMAIAKLIAESRSRGQMSAIRPLMRLAFTIVLLLAILFLLVSFGVMPALFRHLQSDERMLWCFYMLLPGIVIVPISSLIRGYFQGLQQMLYPSIGQIAEQVVRLSVGLGLIIFLKPYGVRFIAAGLAGGMIAGELAGMLVIVFFYYRSSKKLSFGISDKLNTPTILREFLRFGVPTTLSKLTSSLDMALEANLIPFCLLQMGYNQSQATAIYGQVSGVALTLLTIPMVLTGALSTSLLPAISKASAAHQRAEMTALCSEALRLTYIFSLPVIIVLIGHGDQLTKILFHITPVTPLLGILACGAIFLYIGQTTIGIMQGLGQTHAVFINNLLGSVVKVVCIYFLVAQNKQGIAGIALSFVLSYIAQCCLNLLSILQVVTIRLTIWQIIVPLFCGGLMGCVLDVTQKWLIFVGDPSYELLSAIVLSGLAYLAFLMLTKQFRLDEELGLPLRRFTKKDPA